MNENGPIDELDLPDDLRALDAELRSIGYEERPSFGPELRAELSREWLRARPATAIRKSRKRYLAAAMIGGLMAVGVGVPSARAALLQMIDNVFLQTDPALIAAPPPMEAEPLPPPAIQTELLEAATITVPDVPPNVVLDEDLAEAEPPVMPELLDRARSEALFNQAYPPYLHRQGVGGELLLRVWVDTYGLPGTAFIARSTGVAELDQAAQSVVPLLRFAPAIQNGVPVATWAEFPVLFDPDETGPRTVAAPVDDPIGLPVLAASDRWQYDSELDLRNVPVWSPTPDAVLTDAEASLADAIGEPLLRRSLGAIDRILSGESPNGRAPTEWRTAASEVLTGAVLDHPENATPLLALGRIRLRQGLRTEARVLFEQGLEVALEHPEGAPASVVADLHYERALLIQDAWVAGRGAGRVWASAFDEAYCPEARYSAGGASGYASAERLIAWNYLCPTEVERIFEVGWEADDDLPADLALVTASFRAAMDRDPGHVGSNVALLLTLADAGRWEEARSGARRFVHHSQGHPDALLLLGLAEHRLGRHEVAREMFNAGIWRLSAAEADALQDLTPLLTELQYEEYRRLWGTEKREWEQSFWRARDQSRGTDLNERELEHLARATYARLRFGGSTSDPGEVWVRFGGPNTVHIVDAGSGKLTEFWDYGSDPDITFVRWVASQTLDLTPEGRAYVDDLGSIFPPQ